MWQATAQDRLQVDGFGTRLLRHPDERLSKFRWWSPRRVTERRLRVWSAILNKNSKRRSLRSIRSEAHHWATWQGGYEASKSQNRSPVEINGGNLGIQNLLLKYTVKINSSNLLELRMSLLTSTWRTPFPPSPFRSLRISSMVCIQ